MENPPKSGIFQKVLNEVATIPFGKVTTYGDIAQRLSIKDVRIIGWALHTNKDSKKYPCHRVVKKDGSLPSGYVFGGPDVQKGILESEGVNFINNKIPTKFFYST
ncbi:MGMT family protein [bacterium]|nr:MGMT family protein [bacterium]